MRIAIVAAGFEPGQADRFRRAMATFKRVGTINSFETKFVDGMIARGYERDFAQRCFDQIKGFGDYGFPESHAASFANLVYASAWMKCRYPDVFAAALLNAQPMGFYASAQIVRDAQEHGVEVRAVDINASHWDCTLEQGDEARDRLHARHVEMKAAVHTNQALRLGLRQISGFSEDDGKRIEETRGEGFDSIRDLWLRTGLEARNAGAACGGGRVPFARPRPARSLMGDPRAAALRRQGRSAALCARDDGRDRARRASAADAARPAGGRGLQASASVAQSASGVVPARRTRSARIFCATNSFRVCRPAGASRVGGLVLVRQRPGTAKGVIFATLEDETAGANVIIWPATFEKFRPVVLGARLIAVTGKLQNASGVIHVVADEIKDLTHLLRLLSKEGAEIDVSAPADEGKRPVAIRARHPRQGDALVTAFQGKVAWRKNWAPAAMRMP